MARPRAFDEGQVLDAAMDCFWRRGLEATSLRDLTSEMGINRPSLYNAFGDKRELFIAAIERFGETRFPRLAALERDHAPREAVHVFFETAVAQALDDTERRGCFIVNTALEVAPHDPEINRLVAGYLGDIEAFLLRCLRAAQAAHDIPAELDAEDTARMFLGLSLGLRVIARTQPDAALLRGMIAPALALLGEPLKKGNA